MEKTELSNEEMEKITKGKNPFVTISYYEVEGKEAAVASVHIEENFLDTIDAAIFKQVVIDLGSTLARIKMDFLRKKERKEEANSVKC